MITNTVENELIDLENRYWQAIQDKDVDAAMRLTDEPCIVTGAQGIARINHEAFAAMMRGASWTLHRFDLRGDVHVQRLHDDVAIIAYTVVEELTVDGKPVTLQAADASTWVRREGRWVCALHTEALAGDPFGRGRNPG